MSGRGRNRFPDPETANQWQMAAHAREKWGIKSIKFLNCAPTKITIQCLNEKVAKALHSKLKRISCDLCKFQRVDETSPATLCYSVVHHDSLYPFLAAINFEQINSVQGFVTAIQKALENYNRDLTHNSALAAAYTHG